MPGDKTANVSPKTKNPPNNQRKSPKSSDQDLANVPIKNKRTDIIFKVSYFIFFLPIVVLTIVFLAQARIR